jgi:hypothetical protein
MTKLLKTDGIYKIKRSVKTPLFFLPILKGSNFACIDFSLFGGGIIPTATRTRDRGRKSERQRATATRESTAKPRAAQFFAPSRRFLGSVVLSAGWNGSNAIQAIFDGFTAHGLKARNGSRTRHGNRKHAESQPLGKPKNPPQFHNHSVGKLSGKSVALSYNGYYVNVVFCRQILLHFCMCYFYRWILTAT